MKELGETLTFGLWENKYVGGNVYPRRASGGPMGRQPYMVGERGPELFIPSSPGRIVANKDLNSPLTDSLLNNTGAAQNMAGRVIYADTIVTSNAELKNSKVGIDVFA
jgi:hypothetical protein